jgi:hypothetical protein
MNHSLRTESNSILRIEEPLITTFLLRLKKNFQIESRKVLKQFYFLYRLSVVTLQGTLLFFFGVSFVQAFFKKLFPIFFVYIAVAYLTLLPTYSFIPLAVVPIKWTGRILFIAIFYAFFATFLI